MGSPDTCFPGAGDGQIGELIDRLSERGFSGFYSLEPNIARLAEFDGDRMKAVTGAVAALRCPLSACASLANRREVLA